MLCLRLGRLEACTIICVWTRTNWFDLPWGRFSYFVVVDWRSHSGCFARWVGVLQQDAVATGRRDVARWVGVLQQDAVATGWRDVVAVGRGATAGCCSYGVARRCGGLFSRFNRLSNGCWAWFGFVPPNSFAPSGRLRVWIVFHGLRAGRVGAPALHPWLHSLAPSGRKVGAPLAAAVQIRSAASSGRTKRWV
jgi:hypothetical protein